MITLKNGFQTTDPRQDLILLPVEEKDARNRLYAVSDNLDPSLPIVSAEWPINGYIHQGPIGACPGIALGHEALASPFVVAQMDRDKSLDLFYLAQQLDQWPGGAYPGADPYYEGTDLNSAMRAYVQKGYCTEYRWQFGWEDLLRGISQLGPVIVGTRWYKSMNTVDADGFVHIDTSTGSNAHAWLFWKSDIENQVAYGRNGWRPFGYSPWGDFKIRFDNFKWLMAGLQGGEGAWAVGRKNPFTGEIEGEEKKMNTKVLTFAPDNNQYTTGIQLFNMDDKAIKIKLEYSLLATVVREQEYQLLPRMEQLIYLKDEFQYRQPTENYAIYFSSEGQYNVCAYHVHQATGGLFPFPVVEVPTQVPN